MKIKKVVFAGLLATVAAQAFAAPSYLMVANNTPYYSNASAALPRDPGKATPPNTPSRAVAWGTIRIACINQTPCNNVVFWAGTDNSTPYQVAKVDGIDLNTCNAAAVKVTPIANPYNEKVAMSCDGNGNYVVNLAA